MRAALRVRARAALLSLSCAFILWAAASRRDDAFEGVANSVDVMEEVRLRPDGAVWERETRNEEGFSK